MKLKSPYLIKPGAKVRLSSFAPDDQGGYKDKEAASRATERFRKQLDDLQEVFYASQEKALLIVLQGMDTAGKDGTIRSIFSGVNPQGCQVSSFKVPTPLEARHNFLWRCQVQTPPRGMIGIFNRSHYEDVLSPVVHGLMNEKTARRHMDDINAWEETLSGNNTVVLKFFLHISEEEQTRRLQSRLDDKNKHWKLSPADFAERKFWGDYEKRYEDILRYTSTKDAPWFVIPADHKWLRDAAIIEVLVDALKELKLSYPKPTFDPGDLQLDGMADLAPSKAPAKAGADADKKAGKKKHHKRAARDGVTGSAGGGKIKPEKPAGTKE